MLLVPLGVFVACLTALTSPGGARHSTGLLSMFAIGIATFGFFLLFTQLRRAKSPSGSARLLSPLRVVLVVIVLIASLFGLGVLIDTFSQKSPSGVASFICIPVGVSNNVVIVDVNAEVASGGAEVQAALEGPRLSQTAEAALGEAFSPPFVGTLVKPTPYVCNRPWRIWSGGSQTWRLGFVLPDAALAKEAFDNLRPIGPLPAEPRRTFAGMLFEVGQPGGGVYRALLNVTPPVNSGDSNWVSIANFSQSNESGVTLTWELLASQPGAARCVRGDSRVSAPLEKNLKSAGPPIPSVSKLYGAAIQVELTKIDAERVLLVTRVGKTTTREELTASFRGLSEEMLHARNQSFKTVRGAAIELCQLQGQSFTVQVDALTSTVGTPANVKAVAWSNPIYGLIALCVLAAVVIVLLMRKGWSLGKVLLLLGGLMMVAGLSIGGLFALWAVRSGGVPIRASIAIIVVGALGLLIVLGIIALLVLLARKGGTAGKVVALVVAVP